MLNEELDEENDQSPIGAGGHGSIILHGGRTELSTAAFYGDIEKLESLLSKVECTEETLKNKNKVRNKRKREKLPSNLGYFVVVHGGESSSSLTPQSSIEDENQNQEVLIRTEETTTPEGMDKLEWDSELENSENTEQDPDDVWSSQYRWYAKILARTSQHMDRDPTTPKCTNVDDVNFQDGMGRCALHYAADAGRLAPVQLLLKTGAKVDLGDHDSLTPLHLAANRGSISVVQALLENGASVDKRSADKLTPLHYASSRGHADVVSALIKHKAYLDCLDSGDRTPLSLAASRDLYQVVKILVESGAKVNNEDVKGYTALCEAVWHKNVPMTKLLLKFGAKLTPTPYLLHYAILHRHKEMVEVLLDAGAIVNIRDDGGSTPLILSVKSSQPEIVELLLKNGAKADFCGGLSWKTPLMTAIEERTPNIKVIQALIEGGANIDSPSWSVSPIVASMLYQHTEVTITLLAYGVSLDYDGTLQENEIPLDPMLVASQISKCHHYIRAMVYVGFNIHKRTSHIAYDAESVKNANEAISSNSETLNDWILYLKYNPLRLTEIARISIRKMKPKDSSMLFYASSLGLPSVLVSYLMLSDVLFIPGVNHGLKTINSR